MMRRPSNPFAADAYIVHGTPVRYSRALDEPRHAGGHALSGKQSDSARLHACPDGGVEGARVPGSHVAREQPAVPRAPGTGRADPAPGGRQHYRHLHVECRRWDRRGQRSLSPHGAIRPRRSRVEVACVGGRSPPTHGARPTNGRWPSWPRPGSASRTRRNRSAKTAAACRCWSAPPCSRGGRTRAWRSCST